MTGVTPAGSGPSPEGGAASSTASPAKPSVPNATWLIDRYSGPLDVSERGAGFIEGYAAALAGLTYALTGEPEAGKSYDPMTVCLERGLMCSYVFDMKDGGRTHPLSKYATFQEVADSLLLETLEIMTQEPAAVAGSLCLLQRPVEEAIAQRDENNSERF